MMVFPRTVLGPKSLWSTRTPTLVPDTVKVSKEPSCSLNWQRETRQWLQSLPLGPVLPVYEIPCPTRWAEQAMLNPPADTVALRVCSALITMGLAAVPCLVMVGSMY